MIRVFESRAGFALPTILIASMVMLIVLITSVSATSSVRSGLDGQYYIQLAREAAESGLARANGCLQDSSFLPTWNSSALYPNTSCNGGSACTNSASCFVVQRPTIRTTFRVGPPENLTVSQVLRAEGKVELLRASNGEVWRTYTYTASARVSVDLSLGTVAFGYVANGGAYFSTITGDGKVRAVGYNYQGQLGNGTYTDTVTPTPVKLPSNERGSAVYTNFLSGGYSMFVLTTSGKLYGSGYNNHGQLGDGTFVGRTNPVVFGLPGGRTPKHVSLNGSATYVITTDNNVYAAGECERGRLGSSYTISGCVDKPNAVRVDLPTPNGSDLNTIPTNNIVTDASSTFLRMQGGRVYGWGNNSNGQFGNGLIVDDSTPTKLGTFGDSSASKAIDIQTDGITLWVVDDAGKVWGAGDNRYGEVGGGGVAMKLDSLGKCFDNKSSNGVDLQFAICNSTAAQQYTWRTDKTLYNVQSGKCVTVATSDNTTMSLATCNGTNSQKFTFRNDRTILNVASSKCLNNKNNDGVSVIVYTCGAYTNEYFTFPAVTKFSPVPIPAGSGTAVKVATDQWFTAVLTSTGEVYSFGINNRGQLGIGTTSTYQPAPVKFILPAGVTAKDVYVAAAFADEADARNNTFVIGSDGKVYGAGANDQGQLGDGTTTSRSTPVAMQVIDGVNVRAQQVVTGWGTTVVITEDKKVYTVGNNENGQLGDGTTTNSSVPKANRYTNVLPSTSF